MPPKNLQFGTKDVELPPSARQRRSGASTPVEMTPEEERRAYMAAEQATREAQFARSLQFSASGPVAAAPGVPVPPLPSFQKRPRVEAEMPPPRDSRGPQNTFEDNLSGFGQEPPSGGVFKLVVSVPLAWKGKVLWKGTVNKVFGGLMWAVVESFKKYWLELDEKNGALKSLLKHRDDGTYPNSFHRKFAQVKTSIPVAVDEAMDIDDDSDCPSRPAPQNPSLKKAKDDELVRLITETTGHVNRIRSALHDASVRRGIDQYFQEYVVSLEGREIGLFGGAWQAESILARKHLDEALIHTRQDLASIIAMRTINNKLKADKKAEAEARMAAKKVSRTVEEILKDQLSSTNKRLATLEKALKKKNDGGKKKGPKGKPKPKPKAGPGKGKGKGPQGKTPVNKKSKKISKKQKK